MGCDESVSDAVVIALLTLVGMDWIAGAPSQAEHDRRGASPDAKSAVSAAEAQRLVDAGPAPRGQAVARETEAAVDARWKSWRRDANYVAIGNLGEQVALRALTRMGYEVLVTQDDLKGAVSDIVGRVTRMNPEDLIAVDPNGRYVTVNVKTTASESTSGMTPTGDLSKPRMSKGQNLEQYYSTRAELLSSLEGGTAFGQVVKVDLVHKLAQVFDVEGNGQLSRVGNPVRVLEDIVLVCDQNPDVMPPPTGPSIAAQRGHGDGS